MTATAQTVLVVDDAREIARLVRAYREQAGFRAVCAGDGTSAIRALRAERPDLLVLDLMLPDRDGLERTLIAHGETIRCEHETVIQTVVDYMCLGKASQRSLFG